MSTLEQKSEAAIEHPGRWVSSGVRLTIGREARQPQALEQWSWVNEAGLKRP